MGRTAIYTDDHRDQIITRLSSGQTLRKMCQIKGFPKPQTVLDWVDKEPLFAERYARARSLGLDMMAEQILAIADTCRVGEIVKNEDGTITTTTKDMVERAKLQVDARKWLLSKLRPDKYGDRTQMELTGANGGPLEIMTAADTLRAKRAARIGEAKAE